MGSPWIPNIEAEWLCIVHYEILVRDAQSGGDVRWGFVKNNKFQSLFDLVVVGRAPAYIAARLRVSEKDL